MPRTGRRRRREWLRTADGELSIHRLFLLIAPLVYAAYALLTPPFQTPDEQQHLFRAWQISSLELTGERRGRESGGELPPGLAPATLQEIGSLVPQGERRDVVVRPLAQIFSRNTPVGIDQPHRYYDFYGSVMYPPIVYLPQSIGVRVGEAAGFSVEWTLRLGRLINSALCIGLICWALTLIPYGRWIMMIIALLPPTAAGAASFGQDGLINGTGFLLTAAGLRIAYAERWSARSILIAAATGVLLTISKVVYLPLVALAAVPKPRGISWSRWVSAPLLIGLLAAILLFGWMRVNAHAVIDSFRPWVPSAPAQLSWAAAHPLDFSLLMGRTYLFWLPLSWAELYKFGDSTVPVVWTAAVPGTAAIFAAMIYGDRQAGSLTRPRRIWLLLIFAAVTGLIATAMFIMLAPRGAVVIEGIQARYFLPVLPMAAIALMRRGVTAPPLVIGAAFALVLVANAAALGAIMTTFYSF